jgi:hypothetical protein
MLLEKRLAAEYRRKLRNEKISIFFRKILINFYDKCSWMRFGPTFLAVSLFLISLFPYFLCRIYFVVESLG